MRGASAGRGCPCRKLPLAIPASGSTTPRTSARTLPSQPPSSARPPVTFALPRIGLVGELRDRRIPRVECQGSVLDRPAVSPLERAEESPLLVRFGDTEAGHLRGDDDGAKEDSLAIDRV